MPSLRRTLTSPTRTFRAMRSAAIFFLKLFPMLPSRPVDWLTATPVIEKVQYPVSTGLVEGEIYRPPTPGPHPAMLVCLGVVPFEVNHPQVPVLGKALARAGFEGLLYWSPAMRDFRLDPADVENIAMAYRWLITRPSVDASRSGMLGTCVGGSFALMAAASPLVRDQVAHLAAYAPFSSMWTFARDIASASRDNGAGRELWQVDPLTHKVFVHSLTAWLEPGEAERLRCAFGEDQNQAAGAALPLEGDLSADGQAVCAVLTARDATEAEAALHRLPDIMQERLTALSPLETMADIHAPLIVLLHDRGDVVIPVGESRRMVSALAGRSGVQYTEMGFSHLDPVKGRLPLPALARQFWKFLRAVYPVFYQAAR